MTWAILGDIEFDLVDSPQGLEHHFSTQFAQHGLITQKPRLEAIGGALDALTLDISLHYRLGEVAARERKLRDALAAQEPLALVMGNGDYRGPWVLVDGVTTWTKTAPDGQLLIATLKLSLLEYTGQFERPTATPGIINGPAKPGAMALAPRVASATQQIASLARAAHNAVRYAQDLTEQAYALHAAPRAAFQAVPAIGSALRQALAAGQALQTPIAGPDGPPALASLGAALMRDLDAAHQALRAPELPIIGDQLRLSADHLGQAAQRFHAARPEVLKLSAALAMRRA